MSVHYGLTFEQYQALRGLNMSTLLKLRKSPKHFKHALANKRPDTPALAFGKAVHLLLLEPSKVERELAVWDGHRRGNDWKAFESAHAHQLIIKRDKMDDARSMVDSIMGNPQAAHYLAQDGAAEVSIEWNDPQTQRLMKARLDWFPRDAIVDLKSSRNPDQFMFGRDAAKYGYHIRAAWYQDGIEAVTGRKLPFIIIAAEKEPPFDVVVYRVPPEAMAAGRSEYRRLLAELSQCEANNSWPGIGEGEELDLMLPTWAFGEDDNPMPPLTIGGKEIAL